MWAIVRLPPGASRTFVVTSGGSALHIQTLRAPQRVGVLAVMVADAGSPVAAQSLAVGDSLLAAGDTAGAIAAYEAVVERDWGNAEARYRAGVLYFARFRPPQNVSADRRRAEEHLRLATRLVPDSVKYWLALADVYRSQTEVSVRAQVPGLLGRAVEAGRRDGKRRGGVRGCPCAVGALRATRPPVPLHRECDRDQ